MKSVSPHSTMRSGIRLLINGEDVVRREHSRLRLLDVHACKQVLSFNAMSSECLVCCNPFSQDAVLRDEIDHRPRTLPCGHTFCSDCIAKGIAQSLVARACFTCRAPLPARLEDVKVSYHFIDACITTRALQLELENARAALLQQVNVDQVSNQVKLCSTCQTRSSSSSFSTTQWKLSSNKRKCKSCVGIQPHGSVESLGTSSDPILILQYLQNQQHPLVDILSACRALSTLVIKGCNASSICQSQGVSILLSVMQSHRNDSRVVGLVCTIISHLMDVKERELAVKLFCVEEVLTSLKLAISDHRDCPQVIAAAIEGICNCASNMQTRSEFARCEGVQLLLELLRTYTRDASAVLNICWSLMFQATTQLATILAHQGIAIILNAMSIHRVNEEVVDRCVDALFHCSQTPLPDVYPSPTALEQILRTMKKYSLDGSVVKACCECLISFVYRSQDRVEIASLQGVPIIVKCLLNHRDKPDIIVAICEIVMHITKLQSDPRIRKQFLALHGDTCFQEIKACYEDKKDLIDIIEKVLSNLAMRGTEEFFYRQ